MNYQQIPRGDGLLQSAFCIYQTSNQTTALKSEQNRTVFAENFDIMSPSPLSSLCIKVMAQNFRNHQIIRLPIIEPIQLRTFYDFIDENLPIEKCISIEDEYYWKRIYSSKCTDKILLKHTNKQPNISWKNLALTLKYIDLIENTTYEYWICEDMEEITKITAPYITELKISKLQAMRDASFEKQLGVSSESSKSTLTLQNEENKNVASEMAKTKGYRYDFPFQDCHHVDLSILGGLRQLNSLTVEFVPPKLTSNYHNRYFNFSYIDMQNLARGISELKNLRTFKLRRSRMDSDKFDIIIEALQLIFVEELEFFFCQLEDDCGETLYEYLISTKFLKHLDLSGNYFIHQAIDSLARGIQASPAKLAYLGLSNNPFSDESLCNLTTALEYYEYLKVLKLSGIRNSDIGSSGIVKLLKNNVHLVELNIIAVRMNGAALIKSLQNNYKIQQILCQGCGLTLDEEFKVEILLKRNRFIRSNPYIGDISKTEEEINAFLSKTKNTIFIKTMEDNKERSKCLQRKIIPFVDVENSKTLLD